MHSEPKAHSIWITVLLEKVAPGLLEENKGMKPGEKRKEKPLLGVRGTKSNILQAPQEEVEMPLRGMRVSLPDLGSARASTPALPLLLPMNPAALVSLSAKWTHHHSPSSAACLDQTHLGRLGACSSRLSPNLRLYIAGEVGKPWLQVSQWCTADMLCEAGWHGMEANESSFKTAPTRP